jgi:Bacterial regulatory helix-turn-helix proteins, AraC family
MLHAHPADDWTLDRLARKVGLSRTVLADRFAHYVGSSPIQYLAAGGYSLRADCSNKPEPASRERLPKLATNPRRPSIVLSRSSSVHPRVHGEELGWLFLSEI